MRKHVDARLGVRPHERQSGVARRAVGDVGADPGHGPGRGREGQELERRLQVRRPGHDHHLAEIEQLPVPDDLEGLVFQHLGVEDAAVVRRGHGHFPVGEELGRLGARLPPHDLVLDRVQLAERPLDPLGGVQQLVHLRRRHAVGHKRELHVAHRLAAHSAAARKGLQVEEVLHGPRLGPGDVLPVVGDDGCVELGADAALGQGAGEEVLLGWRSIRAGSPHRRIERLEQPLVAASHRVGDLHGHHVPVNPSHVDLRPDFGQATVVLGVTDDDAGLGNERLVVGELAGARVGPAPRAHGQRIAGVAATGNNERREPQRRDPVGQGSLPPARRAAAATLVHTAPSAPP